MCCMIGCIILKVYDLKDLVFANRMKGEKQKSKLKRSPHLMFNSPTVTFIKGSQDRIFKSKVSITNKSSKHMAIKVKTNAPDVYIVKPNLFALEPYTVQELLISCNHTVNIVSFIENDRKWHQRLIICF